MSTHSFSIRVANSRGALPRIVATVYDRGADVNELTYSRRRTGAEGLINLTASGGGDNLKLHLQNVIGVIGVETDKAQSRQVAID